MRRGILGLALLALMFAFTGNVLAQATTPVTLEFAQ